MGRPAYVDKAVRAFENNAELADMTEEERQLAAEFFEATALNVAGKKGKLAYHYNLERARFLRGEVSRIADSAPKFDQETDYRYSKDSMP